MVRFPDSLAGVFRQTIAQDSFFVDIAGSVEAVLHAGHEVFGAVRRRGVDDAGSRVHGDVVSEHAKDFAIEKWMLKIQALQLASGKVNQRFRISEIALCGDFLRQLGGDNINLATGFKRDVFLVGMERDCHRGRERPWSRGPDDGRNRFPS